MLNFASILRHGAARRGAATLFMLACCWAAWGAGRAGAARLLAETVPVFLFAERGAEAARLADEAVRLCPSDPEAHAARAAVVAGQDGRTGETVEAWERVATVRPRLYTTWLRLGRARERAGRREDALAAFAEAVRLAPLYAEPRWQLGNALLRMGRREEAFAEMSRAAQSRPSLLAYTIELAWVAFDGDARAVEQSIAPQTVAARMTLARFLAKRGEVAAAVALFRATGDAANAEQRRALLAELLAAGRFSAAREVWASAGSREATASDAVGGDGVGLLLDGGFESRIGFDETGFGWQFARAGNGARGSLDTGAARVGGRSLRIDFDGATETSARLVSQLVLVERGARYRLNFAGRTANVVSGGLPLVSVGAAGGEARELAQSKTLPPGTSDWLDYAVEFTVPETVEAVVIALRRQPCSAAPCPIFGSIWLDDFTLIKLNR